jgi:3-oxoacyl-[acyl-carrier protein] reductase
VALVTGASRGIGAAIAQGLAQEGCDVAIAARSSQGLEATAAKIRAAGRKACVCVCDLRQPDAPARFVAQALGELGRIDLVVCNAGTTQRGDFLALAEDAWEEGFALKFTAHRRLLKEAWPQLAKVEGSVVIISGAGGRTPGAEFAIGGSVNAALLSLGKALAARGVDDGVRVNVVNPGAVQTGRLTARIQQLAEKEGIGEAAAREKLVAQFGSLRLGTPEDIASVVAFLASPRMSYLHGALIDVDGGQTKTI